MPPLRFFFQYTKEQRKGIVVLLLLIFIVQASYFIAASFNRNTITVASAEEENWLALQVGIDSLKAKQANKEFKIYPFNPNYISDYKGYQLGMSVAEIDRLHKFRETNEFINSPDDFQKVTKVSDSLLAVLSPYFKFPDWVTERNKTVSTSDKDNLATEIYPFNPNFITDYKGKLLGMSAQQLERLHKFRKTNKYVNSAEEFQHVTKVSDSLLKTIAPYFKFPDWVNNKQAKKENQKRTVIDINKATTQELMAVHGIGPAFANRIIRRRSQLGAYVSIQQMDDFEEFSPEAKTELKERFAVQGEPVVNTININTASLNKLTYFPYFNKEIARAIITKRSMKGKFTNIEELLEINNFPVEKDKIIALYLEF